MDCPIHTVKMFHARNRLRWLMPILAAPSGEAKAFGASH
jgi:hypothetical protein